MARSIHRADTTWGNIIEFGNECVVRNITQQFNPKRTELLAPCRLWMVLKLNEKQAGRGCLRHSSLSVNGVGGTGGGNRFVAEVDNLGLGRDSPREKEQANGKNLAALANDNDRAIHFRTIAQKSELDKAEN